MTEIPRNHLPYSELVVNDNLRLEQTKLEDAQELFDLTNRNRSYLGEWLPWVAGVNKVEDSQEFIAKMLESRRQGSEYGYAIKFDNQIAGHISLMHINDDQDPEIGYWIGQEFAGGGKVTEAAKTLSDFGFSVLRLPLIVILAEPKNNGSNRVAEKIGYQRNGTTVRDDKTFNLWAKYTV